MLKILKEMLLDFQELELDAGTARRLDIQTVKGKATICVGVRRGGKSTYLFQIINRLLESGVQRENILYLNFFDDRLHSLKSQELGVILDAYFSLYPETKSSGKIYCFFDEIQMVTGWESFVDRLMRTEKCEIFITGSSARMLSKEIATQMRGRALSWEIFPFSFREYLDYEGVQHEGGLSAKKRLLVQKAFETYWQSGGFPEVVSLERSLRIKVHQEYFSSVLFRDLIERHDVAHPRAVVDLAHRLVDNISSLYTINRLTGYLKSLGHNAPKASVADYLNWFEDAYFLFTVRIYDSSLARANTNPKKVYCIDHSLVTSVSSGILVNSGHLLENLVFTALRRITSGIFYYKTRTGKEVDFIALMPDRRRQLVQVCESLAEPQTRNREITALAEAMAELGIATGLIVTRDEQEQVEVKPGIIEVLPAWIFLLEVS